MKTVEKCWGWLHIDIPDHVICMIQVTKVLHKFHGNDDNIWQLQTNWRGNTRSSEMSDTFNISCYPTCLTRLQGMDALTPPLLAVVRLQSAFPWTMICRLWLWSWGRYNDCGFDLRGSFCLWLPRYFQFDWDLAIVQMWQKRSLVETWRFWRMACCTRWILPVDQTGPLATVMACKKMKVKN